jgi:hypothetical protein
MYWYPVSASVTGANFNQREYDAPQQYQTIINNNKENNNYVL